MDDNLLIDSPAILFLFGDQGKDKGLNSMIINPPPFFPLPPITHLIGHRGLPSLAPENSLKSFQLAAEAGLNWVEFDLQVTQDNELIIMHDDTIDRTTNGTGFVYSLTLNQLQAFRLKDSDLKIPTLAETLSLLSSYDVQSNIELKLPENLTEIELGPIRTKLFNAFIEYIKLNWPENKPWPFVSSFDHTILIQVRKLYAEIPLGFLVENPDLEHLELAKQYSPASVNAYTLYLTKEFMKLANQQNIPIYTYTVNDTERAQELIDWGIYGLFTDEGDKLKAILEKNIPFSKNFNLKQVK